MESDNLRSYHYGLVVVFVVLLLIVGVAMQLNTELSAIDFYENDSHVAQRSGLNLKEGDGITLTVNDDPSNSRVDYTIAASSTAATSTVSMYDDGTFVAEQSGINLVEGSNVTITGIEDAGNNRVDFTISASSTGATGAPDDAQYVTLALDPDLSNERVLAGTVNQITVTDGGANGNVTVATPQDIDTNADVNFGTATLSGPVDNVLSVTNTDGDGSANVAEFVNDSSSPTDNDSTDIDFKMTPPGGTTPHKVAGIEYGVRNGNDGYMQFGVLDSGGFEPYILLDGQQPFSGTTEEVVINPLGRSNINFRVETDTNTNTFRVDAGPNTVSVEGTFDATGADTLIKDSSQDAEPPSENSEIQLWEDTDGHTPQGRIKTNQGGTEYIYHADRGNDFDTGSIPVNAGWTDNSANTGGLVNAARLSVLFSGGTAGGVGARSTTFERDATASFWSREQAWEWVVRANTVTTNGDFSVWIGCDTNTATPDPDDDLIGFRVDEQALKGVTSDGAGTGLNVVDLSQTIPLDQSVKLRVEWDGSSLAEFYANGTLLGSSNTSLPSGASSTFVCISSRNTTDDANNQWRYHSVDYEIELPALP